MASFTATGTLTEDFGTQQVSEKFKKREFVLQIPDGQYPQDIKFQLTQDKCSLLDGYATGQELTVQWNLRGRAYEKNGQTNYFNSLEAWKVEAAGGAAPATAAKPAAQQSTSANRNPNLRAQPAAPIASDDDSGLPF